jgi:hypothetical protein
MRNYSPAPIWRDKREWLKLIPSLWKDLSRYLNIYGLGILEILREHSRIELLKAKATLEPSQKRFLKTLKARNSVRRLFPIAYDDGETECYGRIYPVR